MDHLLFVVNPISGDIPKARVETLISDVCSKNKKDYTVFYTTGENDGKKILKKIETSRPSRVIACGGDGTVNLTAKTVMGLDLPVGIVPLGSANGLAAALEIPNSLRESLDICVQGQIIRMDAIRINEKIFSFHLSDLGFNAQMIKDFEKSGERGMMAYAKSFFRSLRSKSASRFIIEINGQQITVLADMIVIANASKYGTGAIISPGSRIDDGTFELVIFKPIPLSALLGLTLDSFLGDLRNSPYVEIHTATEAKIICKENVLFQSDGELLGEVNELNVKILKSVLNVIVPAGMESL